MADAGKLRIVLLPGIHGTADLFEGFIATCPEEFEAIPLSFPTDRILTYDALAAEVFEQIVNLRPNIVLGESFAGPLTLRFAAEYPEGLIGLVLVASFVLPPGPRWSRFLPWGFLFHYSRLFYPLRALMAGSSRRGALVRQAGNVIKRVNPGVLASRMRSALTVDAREWLRSCHMPILYLVAKADRVVRRQSLKAILRERPDVLCREIQTNHFVLQLEPEKAWIAISEFVRKYCKAA